MAGRPILAMCGGDVPEEHDFCQVLSIGLLTESAH